MGTRPARHGTAKTTPAKVTRGSIYWVNLDDAHPPELGKTRPALVLSNTEHNAVLNTVVIVPISSQPRHIWPLRLALPPLPKLKDSFIVIPGVRQATKSRLIEPITIAPLAFVDSVQDALNAYLGD